MDAGQNYLSSPRLSFDEELLGQGVDLGAEGGIVERGELGGERGQLRAEISRWVDEDQGGDALGMKVVPLARSQRDQPRSPGGQLLTSRKPRWFVPVSGAPLPRPPGM